MTQNKQIVRVRFAPSPTGHLHIGGVRTALFNYLFAKSMGGTFILRIEDTDETRSTAESTKAIFEGMKWLGLTWDEGPFYQSEQADKGIYKKYIDKLLADGKAYHCYCTPEELDEARKLAMKEKRPPKYGGKCRNLSDDDKKKFEAEGRKPTVRFKMPEDGFVEFEDLVRGIVKFENKTLTDLVIQKASGYPTYNFAVVIDDALMKMTHIIRGDDHISNTPSQLNIYDALGFERPIMGHLSMIHGADGTKLSKRHGATSVVEYKNKGYLPQALKNYLALLGWATEDSQQIFAEGELEKKFDIKGCQKSPAVFDDVKLDWMNGEYIRNLFTKELKELAMPFIEEAGLDISNFSSEKLETIIVLEQEKYKTLKEIPELISFFFTPLKFEEKVSNKVLVKEGTKDILQKIYEIYSGFETFSEKELETKTKSFIADNNFKMGQVFQPLRGAVSGRSNGPALFKMLECFGKDEVLKRLQNAISISK
ncbi:MAG: glutamate--tRNA ligase [Elusimicrobiaceae bacterium]|jgi:nondiscriminating glutamyl-tRNA synthetase|nr:glutamate--tRNA ligase [Elusimicrobiaceae bacterium]MBT3955479.1 glutamate--tRNA ligase [Elusimicrobiaceae bacterium]MBT4008348.1 glutamate--tRNA ligase [Elusimicrobiaceae bacterium]MBT4403191.1 glutamate--tRNA ligase [Elusimicrobiaceae bacterium]MBT4440081.1 glutamate--tRNA ligase [Elusimicrobiaceae bacterium]